MVGRSFERCRLRMGGMGVNEEEMDEWASFEVDFEMDIGDSIWKTVEYPVYQQIDEHILYPIGS